MLSKIFSATCIGIESYPIEIEIDIVSSLPKIDIVGLPDQAIKESKDRIKSAIANSGIQYPKRKKILVNLAPADLKKEGPSFDLPIAIGILSANKQINLGKAQKFCIVGELALDGRLRPVKGVLPIALGLIKKKQALIVPQENTKEACLQKDVPIYPAKNLKEVVDFLNGTIDIGKAKTLASPEELINKYAYDFSEVKGQQIAKRALEISVSGGHNIIMVGPPGSGKTMLAKRIPSIFPPLTHKEALEITRIYSISESFKSIKEFKVNRPFRSPHHTTSQVALAGGGSHPKPGEVSMSHNGVLFLDELPEFSRNVLEVLRGPMEDREVTISRAKQTLTFPADFMLVASMNPCPCGFFSDNQKECHCSTSQISKYLSKISGPLLDRIDIHIEVKRLSYTELKSPLEAESSEEIKKRVHAARLLQNMRFKKYKKIFYNSQMGPKEIKKHCVLSKTGQDLLELAIKELSFSARAYHKILKVARTIRDLKIINDKFNSTKINLPIEADDISEAIQYRSLDKNWLF